jgi:hypothetical protein
MYVFYSSDVACTMIIDPDMRFSTESLHANLWRGNPWAPMNFPFKYFLMLNSVWLIHIKCYQAARETGALQAAKNKLEKQVEELTWRLQLEKRMRVSFLLPFCCCKVMSNLKMLFITDIAISVFAHSSCHLFCPSSKFSFGDLI